MSSEFEEAVIAFAQSLDADWATDKEKEKIRKRLVELLEGEFEGSAFAIAIKRIVKGCK